MKKGFYVLPSYAEAIINLPEEYGREAALALIYYGATGELPEKMSDVVRSILILIAPIMEKTANCGAKARTGGAERSQESEVEDFSANGEYSDCEKEGKTDGKAREYFPKHDGMAEVSLEEVLAAAETEKIAKSEAERFYDYYKAQGWRFANGRSVSDLPAALRRWCRLDFGPKKQFQNERTYTKEQLDAMIGDAENFDYL